MTRQISRRTFLKGSAAAIAGAALWGGRVHLTEASEVGKVYDGWREGELEIHSIYTGGGESTFYILPDGTSILCDAGEWRHAKGRSLVSLPNAERHPGEWIARYIDRVNPNGRDVDYMLLSHFHPDHAGCPNYNAGKTEGRGEDYYLSGLSQVGEFIHFNKTLDRSYPDDQRFILEDVSLENYRRFIAWQTKENGLVRERFNVGELDQIRLAKSPDAFDFHLRNIAASGTYWTGSENEDGPVTKDFFAPDAKPRENPLSMAFTIRYGAFRYWAGGDLDEDGIEEAVGEVCGPVDAAKANHHACPTAMRAGFVRAVAAQIWTVNVWKMDQTSNEALERMTSDELYPGPRLVCPTMFPENRREAVADKSYNHLIAQDGGHVVIKAADGGGSFSVAYLTAEDESMKVKAVYGPFESTGTKRAEGKRILI